jgi:hypothetical protein
MGAAGALPRAEIPGRTKKKTYQRSFSKNALNYREICGLMGEILEISSVF